MRTIRDTLRYAQFPECRYFISFTSIASFLCVHTAILNICTRTNKRSM